MKKIAALAVLLALTAPVTPALAEAPLCLLSRDVDRTTVVNPTTILFHMKDGKVYRSTMRSACIGLRFNGFVYVTHDEEICGGSQSIRVLRTDQVCLLGRFTPEKIGKHA
jgi:hypothetical protein